MYRLQRRNVLSNSVNCANCSTACRIVARNGSFAWRCPRKGCQAILSIRDGSFFSNSHLKLTDLVAITYWWSRGVNVSVAVHETGHSQTTIVDWYNFHRDVCAQYFLDHPVMIGGPGKTVEIDESKFGKRKYNRGRYVEGHWVFGGKERDSSEAFMVDVQDRSAATFLHIILKHVRPGTNIISDEWRAYSQLSSQGMSHQTVNHSVNFIDPSTGAHTQGIESTWAQTKRMMRREGVMNTSRNLFPTYLQEFLWRRKFGDLDPFVTILQHVAEQYPV